MTEQWVLYRSTDVTSCLHACGTDGRSACGMVRLAHRRCDTQRRTLAEWKRQQPLHRHASPCGRCIAITEAPREAAWGWI